MRSQIRLQTTNTMKKHLLLFISILLLGSTSILKADEGMWLPLLIQRLNHADMQKMGLHLTTDEIYSVNNSCLKDAVVSLGNESAPFGFFCTGEVVSKEGLILTNHHCGYDAIQANSTLEHDYLTNGFWAKSKNEELVQKGMTISFLVRIEDVSQRVLAELKPDMSETQRKAKIDIIIGKIETEAKNNNNYQVQVNTFFEGNEFYLFVYDTYKDIRLVGAPPSSIGKFGGDTDNWMWPRHTGDFSMFRIYSGIDGKPAEYSKNNIPLKPKYSLPISLNGVKENDFSMIMGYPGNTDRFLTSYGVKLAIEQSNPAVVKIRDKKLAVIRESMESSKDLKLKYSAKYAETSNYWKYFIGQTKGLQRLNIYEKKQQQEKQFTDWVNENSDRKAKYGKALQDIKAGYDELKNYNLAMKFMEESVFQGPELFTFSFGIFSLKQMLESKEDTKDIVEEQRQKAIEFYKDYDSNTDKNLFAALVALYYRDVPKEQHPDIFIAIEKKYKGDFNKYAEDVYKKSIFATKEKFLAFLDKPSVKAINKDPLFKITSSYLGVYFGLDNSLRSVQSKINHGDRLYVAGLREMFPNKKFYPNANSSMRLTYGIVDDYTAADAVHYNYYTTIEGIMEKENPKEDEFIVPERLKEIYLKKDYGRYGENGTLKIDFITNTDITGGNSGSPVINGDGQLVGIAFDGNWEAMSGDIAYEAKVQRTIAVDIRYVLFVIDKYAGATNLIDEMNIVQK